MRVGQLNALFKAFTSRGVKQCVMLGQIAPKNLFDLRPDLRAMGLLFRLKEKNAHTIFGAIGDDSQGRRGADFRRFPGSSRGCRAPDFGWVPI